MFGKSFNQQIILKETGLIWICNHWITYSYICNLSKRLIIRIQVWVNKNRLKAWHIMCFDLMLICTLSQRILYLSSNDVCVLLLAYFSWTKIKKKFALVWTKYLSYPFVIPNFGHSSLNFVSSVWDTFKYTYIYTCTYTHIYLLMYIYVGKYTYIHIYMSMNIYIIKLP